MSVLAVLRPDEWDFPLLLHVLGAMILVGGVLTAVTALVLGWRRDSTWYSRLGFWTLLAVAFPAWWLMRIAGQWIYSKEFPEEPESEPAWVGLGFMTSELGGLLLLLSIILTGLGYRSLRGRPEGGTSLAVRIGTVLAALVLVMYVVAMWAMTTKPD